jgi:hypothetical protein
MKKKKDYQYKKTFHHNANFYYKNIDWRTPLGKEDEALKEPASVQQPLAKPMRIYHKYMTCSKIQ